MKRAIASLGVALVAGIFVSLPTTAEALPVGCIGSCGVLGANGDVTAPPGGGNYDWVSSNGAPAFDGLNLGFNETNGSTLTSGVFSADGVEVLEFYFNFVTSDGAGYPEYSCPAPAAGGRSDPCC